MQMYIYIFGQVCGVTCGFFFSHKKQLGSFDSLAARNGSLASCPTTCRTANPCQNGQPCIVLPNGTAACFCSGYTGSVCEKPLNYVSQVLRYEWRPYKPAIEGLVGPPDVYPGSETANNCWDQGGCNDTWSFPEESSNSTQYVEVKFRQPSVGVAIALYETEGFGTITKVLAYQVDHWVSHSLSLFSSLSLSLSLLSLLSPPFFQK